MAYSKRREGARYSFKVIAAGVAIEMPCERSDSVESEAHGGSGLRARWTKYYVP